MSGVVVVTGGSRGIGAQCVLLAAREGYTVVFSYISNENAAKTAYVYRGGDHRYGFNLMLTGSLSGPLNLQITSDQAIAINTEVSNIT